VWEETEHIPDLLPLTLTYYPATHLHTPLHTAPATTHLPHTGFTHIRAHPLPLPFPGTTPRFCRAPHCCCARTHAFTAAPHHLQLPLVLRLPTLPRTLCAATASSLSRCTRACTACTALPAHPGFHTFYTLPTVPARARTTLPGTVAVPALLPLPLPPPRHTCTRTAHGSAGTACHLTALCIQPHPSLPPPCLYLDPPHLNILEEPDSVPALHYCTAHHTPHWVGRLLSHGAGPHCTALPVTHHTAFHTGPASHCTLPAWASLIHAPLLHTRTFFYPATCYPPHTCTPHL